VPAVGDSEHASAPIVPAVASGHGNPGNAAAIESNAKILLSQPLAVQCRLYRG
jgi:hypothetical protein